LDEARAYIAANRQPWRQDYLALVERQLASEDLTDYGRFYYEYEAKTVRRALGIKPSPETIREQTRARVRKHRAKAKAS
jgi:hypothetical protein